MASMEICSETSERISKMREKKKSLVAKKKKTLKSLLKSSLETLVKLMSLKLRIKTNLVISMRLENQKLRL